MYKANALTGKMQKVGLKAKEKAQYHRLVEVVVIL